MRSQSARLTCIAVVWIAIGAVGSFLFSSHKQLESVSDARRAVDQHAREAADALADLRVGQQAYVASGQGVAFWMPKGATTTEAVNPALHALRQSTTTPAGQSAADEAA